MKEFYNRIGQAVISIKDCGWSTYTKQLVLIRLDYCKENQDKILYTVKPVVNSKYNFFVSST